MHLNNEKGVGKMAKKIIAVALNIKKIPYVNETEVIFTPGKQKIWYTANTKAIEIPNYIKVSDNLLNSFIKKFLKKSHKQNLFTFNYFANKVANYLKNHPYDEVIFENDELKNKILPNFKNQNEYVTKNKRALSAEG